MLEPGNNGSNKLYYGTWLLSNAKKESYAGGWPAIKIKIKRWKYVNILLGHWGVLMAKLIENGRPIYGLEHLFGSCKALTRLTQPVYNNNL